ncbi:MAG: DUF4384 domain-containing protein, partial [Saprospiraceae bacterium]|nr:DUF4384 domain-containing protein [Saprospiraceae bacterium]
LLFPSLIFAQSSYPLGLILDDEEYSELPYTSENIQISSGQKAIPIEVDLTPFCPEVRHQGEISSCVGWSAGYAAMTIERAIRQKWTDKDLITKNANSALFIYNLLSDDDCGAIRMPTALRTMQEKGNCLAREFDFDVNECGKEASPGVLQSASNFRLDEFIRLFDPRDSATIKIKNVKMVLAQHKPVVIGMKILNNFYTIEAGDRSWFPNIGDQTFAGGHAMVVVGYDDQKFNPGRSDLADEMKGAFKIMNSWGKNWGEKGFIWVRYAHFAEYCRHAYALMLQGGAPIDFNTDMTPESPDAQERDLRSLSGTFGFKLYTGQWFNDQPLFRDQDVMLKDNYYVLPERKIGDQFQLDVTSEFANGFIYVFSVDPQGKVEVHFPKSASYNEKFNSQNESALLIGTGSTLTIPSQESALTLTQEGEDHLIVLFSESRIKPKYIDFLGEQLVKARGDINDDLPRLLRKHMVPFSDITYYKDKMGFEVKTRSGGKIVPLILRVSTE